MTTDHKCHICGFFTMLGNIAYLALWAWFWYLIIK